MKARLWKAAAAVLFWTAFVGCSNAQQWMFQDATRLVLPAPLSDGATRSARKRANPASQRATALLVLGQAGTEVMDLLGPYEILSRSGHFDVFTVSGSRGPVPITGALATISDYHFDDAPEADLIVVPAVVNPHEAELQEWLRGRGRETSMMLSICEGARALAEAGLLDGRRATTHFFAIDELQKRYPSVAFQPGYRYVHDDRVVTSAGVSAGLDASLYAVSQFADTDVAERTAAEIGYAWMPESDPRASTPREASIRISTREILRLLTNFAFRSRSEHAGLWLQDGVSELGVAALADTLPRSLTIYVDTLAASPFVRSQHGLNLIPSARPEGPKLDWIVLPPNSSSGPPRGLPPTTRVVDLSARAPGTTIDAGLALIDDPLDAALVAKLIEHPSPRN